MMKSRLYLDESVQVLKTSRISSFWQNEQHSPNLQSFTQTFSCSLNRTFSLRVRFKDVKDIKKKQNNAASYQNKSFKDIRPMENWK